MHTHTPLWDCVAPAGRAPVDLSLMFVKVQCKDCIRSNLMEYNMIHHYVAYPGSYCIYFYHFHGMLSILIPSVSGQNLDGLLALVRVFAHVCITRFLLCEGVRTRAQGHTAVGRSVDPLPSLCAIGSSRR